MNSAQPALEDFNADELREMATDLLHKVANNTAQVQLKQALIDKLTYETAPRHRQTTEPPHWQQS
jgi:hypothetical protein